MEPHLTTKGILAAWEAGIGRRPLDRAITLLWSAGVSGDLAALPLAERDRQLLGIRAATFGPEIAAQSVCPSCGEAMEMALDARDLAHALPVRSEEVVTLGSEEITLRPLTSRDLAAAADAADVPAALRRFATGRESFPADVAASVDAMTEAREAEGELVARLCCAACDTHWKEVLDVVMLLWAEVEAAAHRLMGEVAVIATALGWAEHDILDLSDARRQAYLSLARQA